MFKKWSSLALGLAMLTSFTLFSACGAGETGSMAESGAEMAASEAGGSAATEESGDDTLKIAMIVSGAINDGSWSNSGYDALMSLEDEFGAEVAYSEQVSIDEVPTVLRTYGRENFDIVIAHSMEFDEQMSRVAPEFPETDFVTVNGFSSADNLYNVNFKYWELQYFIGMAGALATENGNIAVIHAMDTPMVALERQAMEQGATFVNPDSTVEYSFTGDWNDQAKAKEASLAQLDNGAEILLANVSSCTQVILDACEERGAYGMGWGDDSSALAPETVVVSALFNMNDLYRITVEKILEGGEERELLLTMQDGAMSMTELAEWMPDEAKEAFNTRIEEYMNGEFEIEVEGEENL